MLVLTRKVAQKVYIGTDICVTVVKLDGGQVRLGIEAPREIPVMRAELISVLTRHNAPHLESLARTEPASASSEPTEPLLASRRHVERKALKTPGFARVETTPNDLPGHPDGLRPLPRLVHGIGIRRRAPSR